MDHYVNETLYQVRASENFDLNTSKDKNSHLIE